MKPQPWLAPLVPLYRTAVNAKNAAYDRGTRKVGRLREPVISIGNLSTGGGGKTPLVLALARLLTDAGISIDVLSRGYGRSGVDTEKVRIDSADAAARYGDEPVLIATVAQVSVYVGRSRFAAGVLAERSAPVAHHVHLLDDGFQHRQLARDLDIVLLHRSDLSARLLPAGHLREPLSSLHRADVVVLREEDRALAPQIAHRLHRDARVWHVHRSMTCDAPSGPALAFCGIARPEEFFAGLRAAGVELRDAIAYPDHHRFTDADLARLLEKAGRLHAHSLVTTEKDAARLGSAGMAVLAASMHVAVAKLEVHFAEADEVLATVRRVLARAHA